MIETIEKDQLVERADSLGTRLLSDFADALSGVSGIKEIRGQGLLIGIELDRPCGELVGLALEQGLLINVTVENTVRLLPPLTLSDAEADQLVETLSILIKTFTC